MKITKIGTRIIFMVLPVVMLSTISLVIIVHTASNTRIHAETEQKLFALLDAETTKIEAELNKTAAVAQGLASYAMTASPEDFVSGGFKRFLFSIIPSNGNTYGGGIWFEPYLIEKETRYFGPYVHKKDGQYVLTYMYSTPEYDYHNQDWYIRGRQSKGAIAWTDVYYDALSGITMLTGAIPFFDRQGKFMGASSADMDIVTIRNIVRAIRVGETGRAFLLHSNGSYIVFADDNTPNDLKMAGNPGAGQSALGSTLSGRENGVDSIVLNDKPHRVYYRAVSQVGWTLGIAIQESEILAPVHSLTLIMLGVTLPTLVIMTLAVMSLAKHLRGIINQVNAFSKVAADGRLQERLHLDVWDEFRSIADNLNIMMDNMERLTRAKGDFLSRMSHEIRTPMNAILGMVQIGKRSNDMKKIKECFAKIENNSGHLLGIINDILDLSKVEAGKLTLDEQPFLLSENVDFVVSMFASRMTEKHINFTLELRDIVHDQLVTDPLRLNQVLINLLSNAVKFTGEYGIIHVIIEEKSYENELGEYFFAVIDSGIGIDLSAADKLFSAFEQASAATGTRYGGTGLGLSIAKSVVDMMGGKLEVESEPGKGSNFSFTIRVPAGARDSGATCKDESAAEGGPPSLPGKRMLIVDDVEINREIIIEFLHDTGICAEVAQNGAVALQMFNDSPEGYYEIILMDMQMPVMDGCAATAAIRASARGDAKTVKIVAMTANVMREAVEQAQASGMDAHMGKPVVISDFFALLRKFFDGKS